MLYTTGSVCICVCSNVLHILRPAKAPGFAYAWLELVSHRIFVGRVLAMTPQQRVCTVCSLSAFLLSLVAVCSRCSRS